MPTVNPPERVLHHALLYRDGIALLVAAMEQITAVTPTAAQLKLKMVALDSAFDTLNYGCRSFHDFLAQLDHCVRTVGRSGNDITLALIDPTAATPVGPVMPPEGPPE